MDFVIREEKHVKALIQVCYDMSNEKTEKREMGSLIECAGELHCDNLIIVTASEENIIQKDGNTIRVIPISKF